MKKLVVVIKRPPPPFLYPPAPPATWEALGDALQPAGAVPRKAEFSRQPTAVAFS